MKKTILPLTLSIFLFSCNFANESTTVRPTNFNLIDKNNIPYIKDPWNDIVGFKNGDLIGIVINVDNIGLTVLPFNYFSKNCWEDTQKEGRLYFKIDIKIPSELYNKECLVIGTVSNISIKKPSDACDNTNGTIDLKNSYIEEYVPNKIPENISKSPNVNQYTSDSIDKYNQTYKEYNSVNNNPENETSTIIEKNNNSTDNNDEMPPVQTNVTVTNSEKTENNNQIAKKLEIEPAMTIVEQMPEFPGGNDEIKEFIKKNLQYPQKEKEAGISGTCYVNFIIEKDGSISDIKVLRGISGGSDCDKEALRIISSMPKWIPGKQNGLLVRVFFNLPIKFSINN
jgi:TonB family protein